MSSEQGGNFLRTMLWPQSRMFRNALALSQATMSAFSTASRPSGTENRGTDERDTAERQHGEQISAGEDRPAWETERTVDDAAAIGVGDEVQFSKPVGDADVRRFAAASGDTNPIHLDDEAAGETRFGGRIAHGTLVGGLISAALARLPGTIVYLSQDMEFLAPVALDSELTAACRIVEDLGDGRFRLTTVVESDLTVQNPPPAPVPADSPSTTQSA